MVDFSSNLSNSLGLSFTYTDLLYGWIRERTQYGVRDSFIHPSYDTSLSIQYNDAMKPVSFTQKIKLSEYSEERELCLVDGKYVYRVRKIKGTLVPAVKSINNSDFRNPRKKIKLKRPDAVYKRLEFTSDLEDSNSGQVSNIKNVSYLREYKHFLDKSFAVSFLDALYYHFEYYIRKTFCDLIEGRVSKVDMIFFKEVDPSYFYKIYKSVTPSGRFN